MITKLDIRSSQGGYLSLNLDAITPGYYVQAIEGLDPVKATLVSASFAQQDGAQYQSSKRETRNIKLTLGLDPDWTVDNIRSLRTRLYSVLMPKTEVTLTFLMSDGLDASISGRVESFESAMFTQEPAVDVSILCFDPDFVDPDVELQNGASTPSSVSTEFNYIGTVEAGILFKLLVNRALTEFTIYQQASDGSLRTLEFQAPLQANDVLTISTVSGNKYATRTRAGTDTSVLYGISPQSSWLELTPGVNSFRVYAEGDPVPYTLQYSNRYGGL